MPMRIIYVVWRSSWGTGFACWLDCFVGEVEIVIFAIVFIGWFKNRGRPLAVIVRILVCVLMLPFALVVVLVLLRDLNAVVVALFVCVVGVVVAAVSLGVVTR